MTSRRPASIVIAVTVLATLGLVTWRWAPAAWAFVSDRARLQEWVKSLGPFGPLALIGINALQVVVAPVPGYAVSGAAGYVFGVVQGTLFSLTGSMLGSAAVIGLTRRWGRPFVLRFVRKRHLEGLDSLVASRGKLVFMLAFIVPFGPHDLTCYAIGLTGQPLGQMLVLVALGRLPGTVIAALVGAGAVELGLRGWVLLGAVALGLGAVYLMWGNRLEAAAARAFRHLAGRGGKPPPDP